ncbi:MAG: hypothetical protein MPK06_01620 [Alphaproteobacteria bacterium]|nr:hypothetical protein [Alphaproteobacteria bacterium]MDA8003413.1 hypothetical protein [Alphaproteobacteria bacterium]MDA8005226.1 hypothetical protein [Alphaproteobacteria bacterium]MDA8012667.1 hypothetical protein [Alphaproteobacteria bacterium]
MSMSVLLLWGEVGLPLLLYLFHSLVLAIPLWCLLGLVGKHRVWAALAFVPLVSRLLCVMFFGATHWKRGGVAETPDARAERRQFAILAVSGLLASALITLWGISQIFFVISDAAPSLVDDARRDRFFLGVFAAGAGGAGLALFYLWSLWRGALLVCARTGHDTLWALYIFVPGFNLLLPWVLCSRWEQDGLATQETQ